MYLYEEQQFCVRALPGMSLALHFNDDMAPNPLPSALATSQINGKQTNKTDAACEDDITACGLGSYTPKWLQILASKKMYVLVYGILGMNQTAIGTYFIGTISTIEKRFKLPSSTFGFISSSWDIGVIITVLIMSYLGTAHKTKWVAISSVIAALSCYLRYLPHILFSTSSNIDLNTNKSITGFHLCKQSLTKNENCILNSDGLIATIIFVFAHFALGVGTSTYNTLGAAYLDDNSMKDKAPFLISLASCFRLLGPTMGFLLASYALEVNNSPELATNMHNGQNYIGAWQWGWVPLGTLHLILALMMAFFPKTLPREAQRRKVRTSVLDGSVRRKLSLKDLKSKLLRLLKNRLLMNNVLGSIFYMLGVIGHRIFLPKYLEAQFMQSASRATFITGTVGIICALVGIFISGYFISKFKPHPRILSAWSLLTKITEAIFYVMFAFISCKKGNFFGVAQDRFSLISSCNSMCDCSAAKYSPICDMSTRTTFFSPCQAGCTNSSSLNGTMLFSGCSCIQVDFTQNGACPTNCEDNMFYFLILLCIMKFLSSTGKAGTTIIQYRSVDPDDKALSIALSEIMVSCLAFIPAPIIYGGILDKSCLLWEEECGRNGNCLLYDEKKLRFYSNFTSSAFILVAVVFDYLIYKSVKRLSIYDDKPEANGALEKLNTFHQDIAIQSE